MRDPVDLAEWTLRLASERGDLAFECTRCMKLGKMDILDLVARFGPDATLGCVRERVICRRCRARQPLILIHRYGWRGEKAWLPAPPRAGR